MSSHKIDHRLKLKAQDMLSAVHDFNVDPASSHIYLFGEEDYIGETEDGGEPGVEFVMANRFIKNINLCMRVNPDKPILIHMKTCGGDWTEGMAIYNAIKSCPVPVTILNYTHARSMSSLIFLAANKRVMMPDSYFMFHDGEMSLSGTVKQVESSVDFSKAETIRMLDIYIEALKEQGRFKDEPEKKIRKMLRELMDKREDVFLTASDAHRWGFADEIFGQTCPYDWSLLTTYTDQQLQR
jgi:ATP-dependent protease ClpP protease subunit